jgi:hypothetical protein
MVVIPSFTSHLAILQAVLYLAHHLAPVRREMTPNLGRLD